MFSCRIPNLVNVETADDHETGLGTKHDALSVKMPVLANVMRLRRGKNGDAKPMLNTVRRRRCRNRHVSTPESTESAPPLRWRKQRIENFHTLESSIDSTTTNPRTENG